MAIKREKKEEIVRDLADKFSKSKTIVFLGFDGMTVKENMEFRRKLRDDNIDYKVSKKTLMKRGLKEAKIDNVDTLNIGGPVAVAVGYEDEIAPSRLSHEYSKLNKKLKILGGFMASEYMDAEEIKSIALLPSKDCLMANLVGTINAPVSGFVNVISGNMRGLVYALKAIGESKGS